MKIDSAPTNQGWQDTEFDAYRRCIEYPIARSLIELKADGIKM